MANDNRLLAYDLGAIVSITNARTKGARTNVMQIIANITALRVAAKERAIVVNGEEKTINDIFIRITLNESFKVRQKEDGAWVVKDGNVLMIQFEQLWKLLRQSHFLFRRLMLPAEMMDISRLLWQYLEEATLTFAREEEDGKFFTKLEKIEFLPFVLVQMDKDLENL